MIPKRIFGSISPHFSDVKTPTTSYEQSDAETSSNEDFFDTYQGLYIKKEMNKGQAAKIYRTTYEPQKRIYENEILQERRNIQRETISSSNSNCEKRVPLYHQQGKNLRRRQEYSYQEKDNPGYSYQHTNGPLSDPYQKEEYSIQTANISAWDNQGIGRATAGATRRPEFSYLQGNAGAYSYNLAFPDGHRHVQDRAERNDMT